MDRPITWRKKFDALYAEMKPNLPRCERISKKAFNDAGTDKQAQAFRWLEGIKNTKYAQLMRVIKDVPQERWEHYKRVKWNDLEEVKLRKKLEEELRLLWTTTMPDFLRREQKT